MHKAIYLVITRFITMKNKGINNENHALYQTFHYYNMILMTNNCNSTFILVVQKH